MTPEEIKEQRDWLDKLAGYTPGPWFPHDFSGAHDGEPNVRDACVSCTHPDHMTVCYMGAAEFGWTGQYCLDRANKNARLIAAAPDLRDRYAAALDEIERLQRAITECSHEIDGYIRQEYPADHPVHERYRQRDFAANPARLALKGDSQ